MWWFRIIMYFMFLELNETYLHEERNAEIFPEDYDMYKPPWTKESPAHVYIILAVMDVDNIDDNAMEFSIQSYLIEVWKDYRLNLTMFQRTDVDVLFPTYLMKNIWEPDLVFDNTKTGELFHLSLPNVDVKVQSDGRFRKSSRYNLRIGCHMDFRYYPMDTQRCYIKIATLSNTDQKVRLHWAEEDESDPSPSIDLMDDIEPLKYVLYPPHPYKRTETWTDGNYTFLYANFTFERRISGTLFSVYFPSALVVCMSWISFWLDVAAVPARVTLGVTSLLTLATQVVQSRAGLPDISYMTAIDVWVFACLMTVFGSLLEYAFAYQMYFTKKKQVTESNQPQKHSKLKPPRSRKDVFVLRSGHFQDPFEKDEALRNRHGGNNKKISKTEDKEIFLDIICRKAFPFLFSLFAAFYWAYYLYLK